MTRQIILYASDLHGSNSCFTKLINVALELRPSAVMIGGDLTGKETVLIGDIGKDRYVYSTPDRAEHQISRSELDSLRRELGERGIYHFVTPNELRLRMSATESLTLKRRLLKARLKQWLDYAASALQPCGIRFLIIPGNDDPSDINEDIDGIPGVENADGRRIKLNSWIVGGLGYSNPTPWNCPRELSESEIAARLETLSVDLSNEDYQRLILLCHVPPYRSGLDIAPEVIRKNEEFVLVPGVQQDVGSTAVRHFIDQRQPMLVLSGHCHDSPGFRFLGRSLCVNAGSSYSTGVLRAGLLILDGNSIAGYQHLIR